MTLLAYIILTILTDRYREHLTCPQRIASRWYTLSAIWTHVEEAGYDVLFVEIQAALDTLVRAKLVDRDGDHTYCLCVVEQAGSAQSA